MSAKIDGVTVATWCQRNHGIDGRTCIGQGLERGESVLKPQGTEAGNPTGVVIGWLLPVRAVQVVGGVFPHLVGVAKNVEKLRLRLGNDGQSQSQKNGCDRSSQEYSHSRPVFSAAVSTLRFPTADRQTGAAGC